MTHAREAQQYARGASGSPGSERDRVLASLTVLYGAKEQAVARDRPAMLHCVKQLIKLQTARLDADEAPAVAKQSTTGAANPAYASWLQADKAARQAERRLQAARIAHSMGGEGPSQQLLAEVSRLRAIANDRLDAAIVSLAGESN